MPRLIDPYDGTCPEGAKYMRMPITEFDPQHQRALHADRYSARMRRWVTVECWVRRREPYGSQINIEP